MPSSLITSETPEPADSDVGTLPVKPPAHDIRIQYSDVRPRKTLPESANLVLGEEPTNPPLSTKTHHAGLLTDVTPTATTEDDVVEYSDILPRKTLPSGATFVLSEEPTPPLLTAKTCHVRPLTLETLLTELHPTVTPKWQKLGELLGMDEDLLDEIFTNNEADEECLRAMLEVWLQKSTNPTWKDVTDAISESREDWLAEYLYLKYILPGMIAVAPPPTSSERMPPSASSEVAGDRQEPAFIERPPPEEAEEICADKPEEEILNSSYTGYIDLEDTMQEIEDQIKLSVSDEIIAPFDHKPMLQDYKSQSLSVLESSIKPFIALAGDFSHWDQVIVPPELIECTQCTSETTVITESTDVIVVGSVSYAEQLDTSRMHAPSGRCTSSIKLPGEVPDTEGYFSHVDSVLRTSDIFEVPIEVTSLI